MLRIRPAQPSDADTLRGLDPLAKAGSERHARIGEWVRGGDCHVALLGDVAIGYAVCDRQFFHQRFVELLMVAGAYRRQGVGQALLRHIRDLAPAEKLWTSTNESNGPMRALLARAGFVASGRVDNLDADDPELIFVHLPGA